MVIGDVGEGRLAPSQAPQRVPAMRRRSVAPTPQPPRAGRSKLPEIEGVRALAAVGVMLAHAAIFLRGSWPLPLPLKLPLVFGLQGVTVFFVLSGVLLFAPFVQTAFQHRPLPSMTRFYRHRLTRIFPAYLAVFLLASVGLGTVISSSVDDGALLAHIGRFNDPVLFLSNLLLVQGYHPSTAMTGIGVSWSLVPELLFYAVLPVLAILGLKLARRGGHGALMAVPALVMIVVGGGFRAWGEANVAAAGSPDAEALLAAGASWNAVLLHSFLANMDLFGYGMLVAVLLALVGESHPRLLRPLRRGAVVLALVAVPSVLLDPVGLGVSTYVALATAAGLVLLLAPNHGRTARFARRLLASRPLEYTGQISYSIYLWHLPVTFFVLEHLPVPQGAPMFFLGGAVVVLATFVLSGVTYRYVEAPAMRWARRRD